MRRTAAVDALSPATSAVIQLTWFLPRGRALLDRRRSARAGRGRTAATMVAVVTTLSFISACATPTARPVADWAAQGLVDRDASLILQWGLGSGDAAYVQHADGTKRALLVDLPGSVEHPDVSPDGTRVAFRVTVDDKDQIWTAGRDGSDPAVLIPCEDPGCFGTDFPAWSPDNRSIVFTSYSAPSSDGLPPSGSALSVVDTTTGSTRVIATSGPGEIYDNARWSPDAARLVFEIDQFDDTGAETASTLAVISVTGGEVQRITDGTLFGGYPDWNPKDDRIVFATYDLGAYAKLPAGAASNLYSVNADGSQLTRLTAFSPGGPRATQPTWLMSGKGILLTYVSTNDDRSAAVLSAHGGAPVVLGGDATHVREVPGT